MGKIKTVTLYKDSESIIVNAIDVKLYVAMGYETKAPVITVQAPKEKGEGDDPKVTEENTIAEIEAYAVTHNIDLSTARTKAEKLAIILGA